MDSDARPHVQTLGETKQAFPWPNPEARTAALAFQHQLQSALSRLDPEARTAALTQFNPEARTAALARQHQLQAVSQSVRYCRLCKHALNIHLPDGALEPCTRSNRFYCGYVSHKMGQKLLIGNLACIRSRNAAKERRKYAARKARKQAGDTASVLQMIDGKARPQ